MIPLATLRRWGWVAAAALLSCGEPSQATDDAKGDAALPACLPGLDLPPDVCEQVRALRLPETLPPARGNRYADNADAAMLGFQLFFNNELGHGVSCATCHLPELGFTDRASVSMGAARGTRNAPTTLNSARLSVFFWDGRADSLWSQPLFAIENPAEMASTRLALLHLIANTQQLGELYQRAFGAVPDVSALPATGRPGDPQYDALTSEQRELVERATANVGKAFEAYMRRNSSGQAALDAYLAGDADAMSSVAVDGLRLFATSGCLECHDGPMLTDEGFHDVGFSSLKGAAHDVGRAGGLSVLQANPFNLAGPYADPPSDTTTSERGPQDEPVRADGAFRTPSLRNVTDTPPYGHDGALDTLSEVMAVHAPMWTAEERGAVSAFLRGLVGERPPLPWSNWPRPQ